MHIFTRYLSRFSDCLVHPNLSATLATDQKWPLNHLHISHQSLAEMPLNLLLRSSATKKGISIMVNDTMLNFGKRYKDH